MKKRALIVFVVLSHLALSTSSYAATENDAEPRISVASPARSSVPIWRSLRYHGRNWVGRMAAQLEIQTPPAHGDSTQDRPRGIAELRTRFESLLLANRSTFLRAFFDRSTGAVINFSKLSLGRRPDFKQYEIQSQGVDRLRLEPRAGEASRPAEQWTGSHRSFYSFVPEKHDCRLVSDPGAMAYLLSSSSALLNESLQSARFCFFSGKTLYLVEFSDLGSSRAKVDYQWVEHGIGSNRSGRVTMDRYGVVARPVAGKLDEKPIRAELMIEADTRIPWRFTVIEGWLKIDVELDEAILGEPQSSRLSVTPHGDH